ncbi:MAG: hypothetical protein GY816_16555 [Cytophagales bacterium]|nr:hypothetical protein [Cytophagales bacterium]
MSIYLEQMMDEISLATTCLQLASKDLDIEDSVELDGQVNPMNLLEKLLEVRIKEMLDKDFNGLIDAFYRMDISENKVQAILELSKPDEVAISLAKVVIEREKQKVITQERYRS